MGKPTGRPNGRPPEPPELRVLKHGRSATEAPIDAPKPSGVPEPPRDLRVAGKRAWEAYWRAGALWLADSDYAIVAELCRIHDDEARMRRKLDNEGWLVRGDSPAVLTAKATHDLLVRLLNDEVKANLALYELRQIALEVGDVKSRPHPLWQALVQARSRLMPLWIEAHMTPSSRARARVKTPTVDPLEEWRRDRASG